MGQVQQFFEYIFNAFKIWIIVQPWEAGLKIRNGKKTKILKPGIYFRLPYFDAVFIQETRLRVVALPVQTLTSRDSQTITVNASIGYEIVDVKKLYNGLYHPELTIQNMAMAEVANIIKATDVSQLSPEIISDKVLINLQNLDYGLEFSYFKLTNYAVVTTYRLIQDQSWISEGLSMDKKK